MANENSDVVSQEESQETTEQPTAAAPEPVAPAPVEAAPAAEAEAEPVAEVPTPVARKRSGSQGEQYHGLGRRKTSVARVLLRPGEGRWTVNGRSLEEFFPRAVLRQSIVLPFSATETQDQFDIKVTVRGGGQRGQADAVRLGVARALLKVDEDFRSRLRGQSLLTRDPREVERKKPGRPKARKRFQFSKR